MPQPFSVGATNSSGRTGSQQFGRAPQAGTQDNDQGLLAKFKSLFGNDSADNSADPFADEAGAATPNKQEAAPKTLDDYADLFTPKADPNAKEGAAPTDPFASLTRENLAKAATNLDFSASIPQELMQKAMGGDEQAFKQAMNAVVQASFVEAMSGANVLSEKRINHMLETKLQALISDRLQDHDFNSTVNQNPLLSNPATKPIRDALTKEIRANNPGISAKELNTTLTGYLQAFASSVTGKADDNSSARLPGASARVNPVEDGWDF